MEAVGTGRSTRGHQEGVSEERAQNVHFHWQAEKRIQKGGDDGRGQAGRRATLSGKAEASLPRAGRNQRRITVSADRREK